MTQSPLLDGNASDTSFPIEMDIVKNETEELSD